MTSIKIDPDMNSKFKRKYNKLKTYIKNLVFENAALCDQVALMQDRILLVKEERRFLLKRLMDHENGYDNINNSEMTRYSVSPDYQTPPGKKMKRRSNSDGNVLTSATKNRKPSKSGDKKVAHHIPLDVLGRPVFPIELGNLTIHSLGEVVSDKPAYHTLDCIYPVGFVSTRVYASHRFPKCRVTYTCKISDGGELPRFDITADMDPESAIIGTTPDYCHGLLLKRIIDAADISNMDLHKPNGAAFFGLSNPTVLNLIQSLVRVRKCQNYKWCKFEMIHGNNDYSTENTDDSTLNFEALQLSIYRSVFQTVPEIKEEPPDELLDQSEDGQHAS